MQCLVDQQLPSALARWLETQGHTAEHVRDCGLTNADDRSIWDYALQRNAILVTKDEGFAIRRANVRNGPAVIWIRYGNATRRQLLGWFAPLWPLVREKLELGEGLIEIY